MSTAQVIIAPVTGRLRGCSLPTQTQRLLQGGCGALICPSELNGCYKAVVELSTTQVNTAAACVTGWLRGCPPSTRTQRLLQAGCVVVHRSSEHSGSSRAVAGFSNAKVNTMAVSEWLRGCNVHVHAPPTQTRQSSSSTSLPSSIHRYKDLHSSMAVPRFVTIAVEGRV